MRSYGTGLAAVAVALLVCGSALAGSCSSSCEKPKDIVDTAVAAGSFKTLAAALGAGELIETLKGKGPFTVFAPTDEAFAKLPEGTVENLLKPENKAKLVKILTYHVVPGKVMAADVVIRRDVFALLGLSEFSCQTSRARNLLSTRACVLRTGWRSGLAPVSSGGSAWS
ncbi:MAG: fasciclin domain-containing protein, partial [Pirellulaceae bacterium]|nr:fasciclin domain-containing protein [Pirellulaceae bacterium]